MTDKCQALTRTKTQCSRLAGRDGYCWQHRPKNTPKKFVASKPDDCPICCYPLNTNEPLECGHWVHHNCILKSGKKECPFCRSKLNIKGEVVVYPEEEPNADETQRLIESLLFEDTLLIDAQTFNLIQSLLGISTI